MFVHRTARFRLTKVLSLAHVFQACVLLPLAVSDEHSVTHNGHDESARRVPTLSYKIIEESRHGELPKEAHAVSHRRSYHRGMNNSENDVLRPVSVPSRSYFHHRRTDVNENYDASERANINVYAGIKAATIYKDKIPFSLIDDHDKTVKDDPTVAQLEVKLYSCVTFRANIIIVLGQILKAPNNRLTIDQFTSLNLILQALIHKRVYTFNLLPILKKLEGMDRKSQFKLVMQALANKVPAYMASTCEFWLNEIRNERVDMEKLIGSMEQPADFLTGIDSEMIDTYESRATADELEPFDEPLKITKKTLGLVFVKIFNKLKNHQIILSQKLFSAILMNLPVGKLNPVLEEYINYIWDVTQNSLLLNWDSIASKIEYGNPYEIVNSVIKQLLRHGDTPDDVKHALEYILLHLKEVPSTSSDEYYPDMQMILKNDNNVVLMLSMIQDDPSIPELADLRDRMIAHTKVTNIDAVLQGMNKYTYQKPIDVLIAFLSRMHGRTQNQDIRDTAAKLLPILLLKEEFGSFTVTVPADVDLVMLLDFLNALDSHPAISALGQKIQHYLEGDLDLLSNLQSLVPKEDKSKCHRPIQCLLYTFSETINLKTATQFAVPSNLLIMIQELVDQIKNAINNSTKCESYNVMSVEHPDIPDDTTNIVLQLEPQDPVSTNLPMLPESSNPLVELVVKPSNVPPISPTRIPPVLTTPYPNNLSPQAENGPVLPPNLKYDRPISVIFSKDGGPTYTIPTKPGGTPDSATFVQFPSIKELLQAFNPNTPFQPSELPDMPEIWEPLKQTLGPNFIEKILGKHVDKTEYPTVISLIDDVLDHALTHPKVMANSELVLRIRRYLEAIVYISTTALFPVIIDSQKITSDVLHVTFDPDNPTANKVDSESPQRIPSGFMTLTIYHPKYWVQQVDPLKPYDTLLPKSDEGKDNPIQELINDNSLQEILGPDFDPLVYPNRGSLLISVLQRLVISQRVKSNSWLFKKLNEYLKGIKSVAQYSKFPNDYGTHLLQLHQDGEINWQPDTTSLIKALPPARTQHEWGKIQLIKSFLETPKLLEVLEINDPSYSTTRGELLKMIFDAAIGGNRLALDHTTLAALLYYKHKILMKGQGGLPIVWVWVQTFIIREEIPLGEIIEAVLDYDSLPHDFKISYNDLITYLSANPPLLQGDDNFAFGKYLTKGTFLAGLFRHFLARPDVSPEAKKDIIQLIPYIKLTGHGAEPMDSIIIDGIENVKIK